MLFWRRARGGGARALCTCASRKIQGGAVLSSVLCNLKEDEVVQPSGSPRSPPCFSSANGPLLQFRQKICPSDIFATRAGRRALLPATHTMQQSIASNRAAILGAPVRARTAAPARRVATLAPVAASRCAPPPIGSSVHVGLRDVVPPASARADPRPVPEPSSQVIGGSLPHRKGRRRRYAASQQRAPPRRRHLVLQRSLFFGATM